MERKMHHDGAKLNGIAVLKLAGRIVSFSLSGVLGYPLTSGKGYPFPMLARTARNAAAAPSWEEYCDFITEAPSPKRV